MFVWDALIFIVYIPINWFIFIDYREERVKILKDRHDDTDWYYESFQLWKMNYCSDFMVTK